jgi:hypothetical protein
MSNYNSISGKRMYNNMKEICEFGFRTAGTQIARDVEKYVYDKLKEAEIPQVKANEFQFTRWWAEKHELRLLAEGTPLIPSDQIIETFPVHLSGFTDPEGLVAEMVYVGYGTSVDFEKIDVKDKIALVDGIMILNFAPSQQVNLFNSLNLAKKKGAVGAIFTNNSPLDSISYVGFDEVRGWKRRLPALSVNNFEGHYLKTLCTENQGKVRVKFTLNGETEQAISNMILGTLAGKTDDIILLGTHLDSTFTGAVDNAGANAGLIELAKYFAQIPNIKREKTIVFAGWTGHECGLIGTYQFHKMYPELLKKISVFFMLDGFGSHGYYNQVEGGVVETGLDERRGLFVSDNTILTPIVLEAALKYSLFPSAYVSARQLPVSDLPPFIFANIPSIMIIGKPVFYHTKYDTIDKCSPDQLERTAKAHAYIIEKIQEIPASKIIASDGKDLDMKSYITKKDGIPRPHGSFSILPYPIPEGFSAIFYPTVMSAPKSILLELEWDFGDGIKSPRILTRHAYEKAGIYEVTLKAMDNFGNISIDKRIVRVIKK